MYAQNYEPQADFSQDEANAVAGRSQVRTGALDDEFAAIATSINRLNDNQKLMQRDDGQFKDFSVGVYALNSQLRALLSTNDGEPRGDWTAYTEYSVRDVVDYGGIAYLCHTEHTSTDTFDNTKFMDISGDGSAAVSAAEAEASAIAAGTSELAAAAAATTAENAATSATTSATAAASSAAAAATSASSASSSATSASSNATSAAASAASAAASATTASNAAASVALVSAVAGQVRNLRMSIASASDTATITADEVVMVGTLGGTAVKVGSVNKTLDLTTTGANGMDTGVAPISGFVSIYAIYNPTTATVAVLACNATTSITSIYTGLNMPSGYTRSGLIGVWPTNASRQLIAGILLDRTAHIGPVTVLNASSGHPTSLGSLSIATAVPAIATGVIGVAGSTSGSADGIMAIAATSGGLCQTPLVAAVAGTSLGGFTVAIPFEMPIITAQTIFYMTHLATRPTRIDITGYRF